MSESYSNFPPIASDCYITKHFGIASLTEGLYVQPVCDGLVIHTPVLSSERRNLRVVCEVGLLVSGRWTTLFEVEVLKKLCRLHTIEVGMHCRVESK